MKPSTPPGCGSSYSLPDTCLADPLLFRRFAACRHDVGCRQIRPVRRRSLAIRLHSVRPIRTAPIAAASDVLADPWRRSCSSPDGTCRTPSATAAQGGPGLLLQPFAQPRGRCPPLVAGTAIAVGEERPKQATPDRHQRLRRWSSTPPFGQLSSAPALAQRLSRHGGRPRDPLAVPVAPALPPAQHVSGPARRALRRALGARQPGADAHLLSAPTPEPSPSERPPLDGAPLLWQPAVLARLSAAPPDDGCKRWRPRARSPRLRLWRQRESWTCPAATRCDPR
jgi:hypothetical protein